MFRSLRGRALAVLGVVMAVTLMATAPVAASASPSGGDPGGYAAVHKTVPPHPEGVVSHDVDLPHGPVHPGDVTIPYWQGSFQRDGQTYPYRMVGSNPADGSATTTVPVVMVPLRFVFDVDGSVVESSSMVPDLLASPIFTPLPTRTAFTQFGDAIQRESFFQTVSTVAPEWHTLLGQPQVLPTVTVRVPVDKGISQYIDTFGRRYGYIEIDWLNSKLQSLLTSMRLDPRALTIFLGYNTNAFFKGEDVRSCVTTFCEGAEAFHSVQNIGGGADHAPRAARTYIYDQYTDLGEAPTDIGRFASLNLSHEVLEWLADPFADNRTPEWQWEVAPLCGNILEVADPVSSIWFVIGASPTYLLTDAVYLPWFTGEQPSSAWQGRYDILGAVPGPSSSAGCGP